MIERHLLYRLNRCNIKQKQESYLFLMIGRVASSHEYPTRNIIIRRQRIEKKKNKTK